MLTQARNATSMTEPVRMTQVDDQMTSITMGLDDLESVVSEICRRLADVTGPIGETNGSANPGVPLVPFASRLSNVQARINATTSELRAVLSQLEI